MQKTIFFLATLLIVTSCGSSASNEKEPTPTTTVSPEPTTVSNIPSPNIGDSTKVPPSIPKI